MKMMKNLLLGFALSAALFCGSCAALKPIIRTIVDIATLLCENAASEKPIAILQGKTPQQWCKIQTNLQPFIDEVLKARQAATEKSGIAR
jgi:hypothetical protein